MSRVGAGALLAGAMVIGFLLAPGGVSALGGDGSSPTSADGALGIERFVAGVPDSIPTLEELVERFQPGGDARAGRDGIRMLAAVGEPAEATAWIQLLSVVERIDPDLAPTAVRAVGLGRDGDGAGGAELLVQAASDANVRHRPALLHLAALVAEPDAPEIAGEVRRRLLHEHPDSFEAPEAALREARRLLALEEGREEGMELLEELLTGAPEHPIAPAARRLYDQERARTIPRQE